MPQHPYAPPLDQLLQLGEPDGHDAADWLDYRAMGMGPEHVPALIRMATDEELNGASPEAVEVWAPIHAMRALAQLGAVEAVEPLLELFRAHEDDDWLHDTLPRVMVTMGPAAIDPLVRHLHDAQAPMWTRVAIAVTLQEMGRAHPETRDAAVAALAAQLERFEETDPILNADVAAALGDLAAVETAGLMERAFAADAVDLSVAGDWEDAQVKLGLKEQRDTPRPNYVFESLAGKLPPGTLESMLAALERTVQDGEKVPLPLLPEPDEPLPRAPTRIPAADAAARVKARKKMEKQSRKKNRKRR